MPQSPKNILLGITGGIAAYKSVLLLRMLRQAGCAVQVVLTEAAKAFVTPLTLQALSGRPVRSALFDAAAEHAMDHIALARWADAVVVAPASADFIARLRVGMADDLLATLCLATEAPVVIAPAMNRAMWAHPATQENVQALQARGVRILRPEVGAQACGETGAGRMMSPETIVAYVLGKDDASRDAVQSRLADAAKAWRGRKALVTAGPTHEPIDPVRYIANRSSGRMGFSLAEALARSGAEVTLIAGPVNLPTPEGVERIDVETARQMLDAALSRLADVDIFIAAAAVADWRVAEPAARKLKKKPDQREMTLRLVKNPDILAEVARHARRPKQVVGFAAETDNLLEHAREKLQAKGLDMIVANAVGEGKAFGQRDNAVWLLHRDGRERFFPRQRKDALAGALIEQIARWSQNETDR